MSEKECVLVVDDSAFHRQTASQVLERNGFDVVAVNSGLEAIAEIRKRNFDAVTLDVEMPSMDGIEVLRILKTVSPDTPVIMVSAAATMKTALSAIRQGAYDYILKPFVPEDLVLSLQRALKQRALQEENRRLINDLRSLNDHLEDLVRERTQALERSERKLLEYAHDLERAHSQLLSSHEELRDAYRKLSELDGLKAKFISITSHELRTPLTTIYGFASLIASGRLTNEKQEVAFAAFERNLDRLVRIVTEITDIAQLKEKRLYLRREQVDLPALIGTVIDELRPLAEGRQQRVSSTVVPGLPQILADKSRLSQVLQQLILNAIRFTPDGGSIEVTANHATKRSDCVQISVRDTGIGIDHDQLDLIFAEFYEALPSLHRHSGRAEFRSGGLGLGLAVVKGLVEEHGGMTWAESPKSQGGTGSTFHVLLPVAS